MTPMDKTTISAGLAILALIEFFTAMYLYGNKGPKRFGKLALRFHRATGYLFLVWFIWVMWIGVDLLGRLSDEGTGWQFHGPRFYHAFLAVVLFLILLLKIAFVRFYRNYRTHARWMGFVLTLGTVTVWLIAGWFYMIAMGSPVMSG